MSLSSTSNTINALGIFGILESKQRKYFSSLENKPKDFYNHLSLVINKNVPIGETCKYLDLLKELKKLLPLKLNIKKPILIDDKHIALSFDTKQTQKIRNLATKYLSSGIIKTHYTKVVWNVPKDKQEKIIAELSKTKELIFYDFILVANIQNEKNTIYSSQKF